MKNLMIFFLRVLIAYSLLVSPAWATTFTWSGAVNDDWFNPGNWNFPLPMLPTDDVVIPIPYPNPSPVIRGPATVEINDLTISICASCLVSNVGDPILIVHGNLVNGGFFTCNTGQTTPAPIVEGLVANQGGAIFTNNSEFTIVGDLVNFGTFTNNNQLTCQGNLTSNGKNMGSGVFLLTGVNQSTNGSVVTNGLIEVFSNLTTNNSLTLLSDGQLLHGVNTILGTIGTVTGNISIQRIGNSGYGVAWNYYSSPVYGASTASLGATKYSYNPLSATDTTTAGLQAGWKVATGLVVPGLGYISDAGVITLTGTISRWNTISSDTVPVVIGGVPYNLLGNPFPCAMSAASFMAVNGPVSGGGSGLLTGDIWLWDDDHSGGSGYKRSDFAVWNGLGGVAGPNNPLKVPNGYIVTGQSFFVEADSVGGAVFNNDMRDPFSGNSQFFKQAPVEKLWVNVTNTQGLYNEVLIGFLPNATDGYDKGFDTRKRRGNPNIALYTRMNQEDYAIQSLPELTAERIVELGLDAGLTGTHTLSLKEVENIDETVIIWLEDKLTGTWQNLRLNPSYNFDVTTPGTIQQRFYLHFNPPMEIATTDASCNGADASITLNQTGSQQWYYILFDSEGKALDNSQVAFNGTVDLPGLEKGEYSLMLSDGHGYQCSKSISVDGKAKVTAEFMPSAQSLFEEEEVMFTNLSAGADSYAWDFGDGTPVSSDVDPVHQYAAEGTYRVTLQASNADCDQTYHTTINVQKLSTGINSTEENDISVYTFDKTLNLKFNFQKEERASLTVYDMFGKAIFSRDINTSGSYAIELKQAAAGNYMVQVMTQEKTFTTKVHIGNQ